MMSKKISDISDVIGGFAFQSSAMKSDNGRYQIIKMSNLYQGTLDLDRNPSFLDEIEPRHNQYLLQEGDILMTLTGTIGKKDYGYSVQIEKQKYLLLNQRVCLLRPKVENVNGYYLLQLLRSKKFLDQFFESSIGGTGNQSNVSITLLKDMTVVLPEIEDQTAIADLLSTWDQAIEKTERLIAAKKKRFLWLLNRMINEESIQGEWNRVKLGEVFGKELVIEKGKSLIKDNISTGRIPVVAGGQTYAYYHGTATHEMATITISASGAYAGFVWFHDYPIWASDCNVIYAKNSSTQFYYYVFKSQQDKIYALQSGGAQPHVYAKDLRNLVVPVPPIDIQEQIAATLNTAQQEIDLLKKQADAYRKQKRGLMQKLLTGQW